MMLKGSPRKNNLDNIVSKRSPKNKNINVNVSDYCGVKSSVKDLINNRMLKENKPNNNNINHQNIIRGSPRANYYTTLSKENIKKNLKNNKFNIYFIHKKKKECKEIK